MICGKASREVLFTPDLSHPRLIIYGFFLSCFDQTLIRASYVSMIAILSKLCKGSSHPYMVETLLVKLETEVEYFCQASPL